MRRLGIPRISARWAGTALGLSAVAVVVLLAASRGGRTIDSAWAQVGPTGGQGGRPKGSDAGSTRAAAVALARLVPATGLISVGARPGIRIDEIQVKEGDQVARGAVLATLEGRSAARHQLELAKAQKTLSVRQNQSRLESARKAAEISKNRLGEANLLYKQFGATLKGKDRYDAEMALYQVEMQALKTDLDLKLLESAKQSEGSPSAPKGSETGGRGPEDEILDAQVGLAETALAESEVRARDPVESSASWRTRASSAPARSSRWGIPRRWSRRPRFIRVMSRASDRATPRRSTSWAIASRVKSRKSARRSAATD